MNVKGEQMTSFDNRFNKWIKNFGHLLKKPCKVTKLRLSECVCSF